MQLVAGGGEGEDDTDHSEESEDEGRPMGVLSLSSPTSLKRNVSIESMTPEATSKRLRANPDADEDQSGEHTPPDSFPADSFLRPDRALRSTPIHNVRDKIDRTSQ